MRYLGILLLLVLGLQLGGCSSAPYVDYDHVTTQVGGELLNPPKQWVYSYDLGDSYYHDRLEPWRHDVRAYYHYLTRYMVENKLVDESYVKTSTKQCGLFVVPPRPKVGRLREVDPTDSDAVIDALVDQNTRLKQAIVEYDEEIAEALHRQVRACQ